MGNGERPRSCETGVYPYFPPPSFVARQRLFVRSPSEQLSQRRSGKCRLRAGMPLRGANVSYPVKRDGMATENMDHQCQERWRARWQHVGQSDRRRAMAAPGGPEGVGVVGVAAGLLSHVEGGVPTRWFGRQTTRARCPRLALERRHLPSNATIPPKEKSRSRLNAHRGFLREDQIRTALKPPAASTPPASSAPPCSSP